MCACLTFSSKAAGTIISSLMILASWGKYGRRNTIYVIGLKKIALYLIKISFQVVYSEKKKLRKKEKKERRGITDNTDTLFI